MKNHLQQHLLQALQHLQQEYSFELPDTIHLERPREKQHGDFASNIALVLAKQIGCKPRELAEKIVANLPASEWIQAVTLAGPGFINISLTPKAWHNVISDILSAKKLYGHSEVGKGEPVHIEFVSSNPTGPLHVGHGRSAAYGDAVANLLDAVGFKVHREYYVNDGGRQMDILATSVWLRYLQLCGETILFPSNGYQGDYVVAIAEQIKSEQDKKLVHSATAVFTEVPLDEPAGGDKEAHIDGIIRQAKKLLGALNYQIVFEAALNTILAGIHDDLAAFGVKYDEWFSERSLLKSGADTQTITQLKTAAHTYEREGALWFNSSAFGDDKDRVLLRENGQPTYFAVDAAYRKNIIDRGFTRLINVLGSDHHGYVPRIRAVIEALGYDPALLQELIVQFAVLYRGKERVQMSTRSGSFVTLRELCEEVGTDAARFFYVLRKCEQHMDFDLELAKSQSSDNPVYYVQYAHARISSVMRQLAEKQLTLDKTLGIEALSCLTETHELHLLSELGRYQEILLTSALQYEPHMLAHYLRDLAHAFHTYYNSHVFLVDDSQLRNARLTLILATQQILANGLKLLGVSAPEAM